MSTFRQKLERQWSQGKFLCVGLDADLKRLFPDPDDRPSAQEALDAYLAISVATVDATAHVAAVYKINLGFPEECEWGWLAVLHLVRHIRKVAPDAVIVLDGKRGDIGNTSRAYADAELCLLAADAVTVSPYLGQTAIQPFLDKADKGIIVLCRTSNPGADEFQDRLVQPTVEEAAAWSITRDPMPLYQLVAYRVSRVWNAKGNCALVVGATCPEELGEVRRIVGNMPLLIPGLGKQGGSLKETVRKGLTRNGDGIIPNVSSDIMYAPAGPRIAANLWHDNILEQIRVFESCE